MLPMAAAGIMTGASVLITKRSPAFKTAVQSVATPLSTIDGNSMKKSLSVNIRFSAVKFGAKNGKMWWMDTANTIIIAMRKHKLNTMTLENNCCATAMPCFSHTLI